MMGVRSLCSDKPENLALRSVPKLEAVYFLATGGGGGKEGKDLPERQEAAVRFGLLGVC